MVCNFINNKNILVLMHEANCNIKELLRTYIHTCIITDTLTKQIDWKKKVNNLSGLVLDTKYMDRSNV